MGEVTIHAPLPDPFRFDDGRSVHTVADWDARREEIATRLLAVQYGTMPPAPEETRVETGSWEALPDGRRRRLAVLAAAVDDVRVRPDCAGRASTHVHLSLPLTNQD